MRAIPAAAKATLGIQAAASGDTAPASPSAPATRSSIMKTSTVARESPIPNAAPPRLLLVASGAPKRMMISVVTGIEIFCSRFTSSSFAFPPVLWMIPAM